MKMVLRVTKVFLVHFPVRKRVPLLNESIWQLYLDQFLVMSSRT